MTDDKKLECILSHLIESHLDIHGGYPYDYDWIGDTLVVATLDDGKERHATKIEKYTRQALLDWYDRAAEWDSSNLTEALWETA